MKTITRRDGTRIEVGDDYILQDGESMVVGLQFMDSRRVIHDGRGNPAGQRPGFLFSDDDPAEKARDDAYREYAETVSERWRQPQGQRSGKRQSEPQTFANPEAAVAASYAEYNRAIQERWRK